MKLSKPQIRRMRHALRLAIDHEESCAQSFVDTIFGTVMSDWKKDYCFCKRNIKAFKKLLEQLRE